MIEPSPQVAWARGPRRRFRRLRARWRKTGPNAKGAAWLLVAAVAVTAMFVLVKLLEGRLNPFQVTFVRSGAVFFIIPYLLQRIPPEDLAIRRPLLLMSRSVTATVSITLAYYALSKLPLADAQAISFSSSLFLVPLAALFLSEKIGPRRWAAALVGFSGVLVMLRPTGELNLGAVAALASAFLFAATAVQLRLLSRGMTASAIFIYGVGFMGVFSAIPAFLNWTTPTGREWVILLSAAVAGAISQYSAVRAFSVGEAAAIGPIDYTRLVFATAAGVIWFGETPDLWTAAGAVIIIGSTLYISIREARAGGRAKGPPPPVA